ncbi:hypothetical protein [Chitinophaga tropicalis]|uniref:Uncharacterized protein n=1 Tax=Chitinophaga tropicalis TaxID=2683588 RepID=A0A7K1U012_9BACT|nr:hypothetical protein [Chitinophaga tropicalis]MVT07711.1 hypothetical protein [Chitinophaga tropicalis]
MQKVILFVVVMLVFIKGFSQPSYKKGCIVTRNADTLRGYIYFNRINTPLFELRYRPTASAKEKIISSADISCYWIRGQGKFISTPVLLSIYDLHRENDMVYNDNVPVIALLKELVKGPNYSLYKMEYEKDRFFICREDTPRIVEELINLETSGYYAVRRYRQQLASMLDDEDPYQEQIRLCEYVEGDLKKVATYLNEGAPVLKSRSHLVRWYVGAGIAKMWPYMGSHFYTLNPMTPALGISLTAGFTRPWLKRTEKLISGSSLTLSALQSCYQPARQDPGFLRKNTHDIMLATLTSMISYRVLDRFHFRCYAGLEGYARFGIFKPVPAAADASSVWKEVLRKTLTGVMSGININARVEFRKISIAASYALKTLPSFGNDVTLDCKSRAVMLYYYF